MLTSPWKAAPSSSHLPSVGHSGGRRPHARPWTSWAFSGLWIGSGPSKPSRSLVGQTLQISKSSRHVPIEVNTAYCRQVTYVLFMSKVRGARRTCDVLGLSCEIYCTSPFENLSVQSDAFALRLLGYIKSINPHLINKFAKCFNHM